MPVVMMNLIKNGEIMTISVMLVMTPEMLVIKLENVLVTKMIIIMIKMYSLKTLLMMKSTQEIKFASLFTYTLKQEDA